MLRENRRVVLAARPQGVPRPSDFRVETVPLPDPGDGEMLVRVHWISIDPYVRSMLDEEAASYTEAVSLGGVVEGGTVGQVEVSKAAGFSPGDWVQAYVGWQEFGVCRPADVRRIDPTVAPVSTALGVLGMTGMTAYTGLLELGRPAPGETLVVAAASGAVGSIVGQIAKIKGMRNVGIAGGPTKCKALIDHFGFDAAVDHRSPTFAADLAAAVPHGVDIYFENVGGPVTLAVLPHLNRGARIPLCGFIHEYNHRGPGPGPDYMPVLYDAVLSKRATLRGFIVSDFEALRPRFERDMAAWVKDGTVKYREDVLHGLEQAPEALARILEGRNFGKMLVKLG